LDNFKHQVRRGLNPWRTEDEAVYKRLTKKGRVVYGQGSYGIPAIRDFAYDSPS
jgi:hypothetical protein